MISIYDTYKKHICSNCKNKHTDLCEIKRRYDNTLYCNSYDKEKEFEKKIPAVSWLEC